MSEQAEPRRWWPDFMCDETMPPAKASPAEWLEMDAGAIILGRLIEEDDGFRFSGETVAPGQVVEMHYCDYLGALDVALAEDGSFTVQGVPPEGFTQCWNRDEPESCGDNLLEMIARERDLDTSARTIEAGFVRWGADFFVVTLKDGVPGLDRVPVNTMWLCESCGVASSAGPCQCAASAAHPTDKAGM
ncbi:hypothetical protein [Xanthobacter aminoxidans]|uniref:hypothetical protein n=1 Tax=Xanthobacter aminoxidans TaxID=186280 RepID=UPI002022EA6B|nr:hypothetical protein [Xanthobacter aminoxidans]MCL8385507.1 hypothetical protein [Xanthobacter aminoxidans]